MRGLYKATVEKPGGVTVSARKLYEIIKELNVSDIDITSGDNNWTTIQAGKSQFKIVGLPSTDYPALPTIEREGLIPLAGAGFLELIRKTLFAAGDNGGEELTPDVHRHPRQFDPATSASRHIILP